MATEFTKGPAYEVVKEKKPHGFTLLSDGDAIADFPSDLAGDAHDIARKLNIFPELLEALKVVAPYLNPTSRPAPDSIHEMVSAAIAKAEGK